MTPKPQPAPLVKQLSAGGLTNGHGHNDSVDNLYDASDHSNQEKSKWGGFFGKDRDKDKDAQQELVRMIGTTLTLSLDLHNLF